jgi:hypothetical protein
VSESLACYRMLFFISEGKNEINTETAPCKCIFVLILLKIYLFSSLGDFGYYIISQKFVLAFQISVDSMIDSANSLPKLRVVVILDCIVRSVYKK